MGRGHATLHGVEKKGQQRDNRGRIGCRCVASRGMHPTRTIRTRGPIRYGTWALRTSKKPDPDVKFPESSQRTWCELTACCASRATSTPRTVLQTRAGSLRERSVTLCRYDESSDDKAQATSLTSGVRPSIVESTATSPTNSLEAERGGVCPDMCALDQVTTSQLSAWRRIWPSF